MRGLDDGVVHEADGVAALVVGEEEDDVGALGGEGGEEGGREE